MVTNSLIFCNYNLRYFCIYFETNEYDFNNSYFEIFQPEPKKACFNSPNSLKPNTVFSENPRYFTEDDVDQLDLIEREEDCEDCEPDLSLTCEGALRLNDNLSRDKSLESIENPLSEGGVSGCSL